MSRNWRKVWICLAVLVLLYHLLPPFSHAETLYADTESTKATVDSTPLTGTLTMPSGPLWPDEWQCKQCPADRQCGLTVPSGDGCNTCYKTVWCENGKWKTHGIQSCTLVSCSTVYEIENPFKGGK